jgi:trans-2,3-dihydro-3-hydroxyanthranilate isomerase
VQRIGDSLYPTTVTHARGGPATVSMRQSPPETHGCARDRAALAAALRVPPGQPVIVVQGHAVGRPSRLVVHVEGEDVWLSGAGLVVATGTLRAASPNQISSLD